MTNEPSWGFSAMTPSVVKLVAGYLSRFRLAFAMVSIITALRHSSFLELFLEQGLTWHIVAQRELIGRELMGCKSGLHTALRTGLYMTWLRQFFCHGRERQVGCLVQIDTVVLGPGSGRCLLLNGAA